MYYLACSEEGLLCLSLFFSTNSETLSWWTDSFSWNLGHPQHTILILCTHSLDDSEPHVPHETSFLGA